MTNLKRGDIMAMTDIEKLRKTESNLRNTLADFTRGQYGSVRKVKINEVGFYQNTKKLIAVVLTRISQLDKGSCPKGGLHKPYQNRANERMCMKCAKHIPRQ
jgi:hypothetical protein